MTNSISPGRSAVYHGHLRMHVNLIHMLRLTSKIFFGSSPRVKNISDSINNKGLFISIWEVQGKNQAGLASMRVAVAKCGTQWRKDHKVNKEADRMNASDSGLHNQHCHKNCLSGTCPECHI